MLKSNRLTNYFIKTNLVKLMATRIKHGRSSEWANTSHKSSRSSVKELSPNGVSMTNSTAMSNTFDDHFSTIGPKLACKIPLNNGPSFQEFKYLWPLKWKIPNSSPLIVIRCCLFLKNWINLKVLRSRWNI